LTRTVVKHPWFASRFVEIFYLPFPYSTNKNKRQAIPASLAAILTLRLNSVLTLTNRVMADKTEILKRITKEGFPKKEVVVSVEEFFEGNEDDSSIGCNIYPDPPSLQTFYETFKKMKSSDKIENILIRIADAEDTDWFYTDTVYVIGNVTMEEVKEMLKDLKPDEIYAGWMYGLPQSTTDIKRENKIYSAWWD
jgi:hypothetical protein